MSFVHVFITLWTRSNISTRQDTACSQWSIWIENISVHQYHWLLLCYNVILYVLYQGLRFLWEHVFASVLYWYVVALLQRMLEQQGLLVAGGYLLFLLITTRADYNRGTAQFIPYNCNCIQGYIVSPCFIFALLHLQIVCPVLNLPRHSMCKKK